MKSKWPLVSLLGFYVFLVIPVTGCTQTTSEADLNAAYERGKTDALIQFYEEQAADKGNDQLAILQQDYESLKVEYDDLESRYRSLRVEQITGKPISERLQDDYTHLSADHERMSADITQLQKDYDRLASEYDTLKSVHEEMKRDCSNANQTSAIVAEPRFPWDPIPQTDNIIKNLAYIKAIAFPYSDDADQDTDGYSIKLDYYNNKSDHIYFSDVPITITVELFWYTNYSPIYHYQTEVMDSGGLFNEITRIPFDSFQEGWPSGIIRGPILVVVVTTPRQGEFRDKVTLLDWR